METLQKIIGILCITGYVTGLLSEFIPAAYVNKAIRLTVALYIISNAIIPLNNLFDIFEISITESVAYSDEVEIFIIENTEKELEKKISQELDNKNISYYDVDVNIHKQSESLQIEKINVYGIADNQKAEAEKVLAYYENVVIGD